MDSRSPRSRTASARQRSMSRRSASPSASNAAWSAVSIFGSNFLPSVVLHARTAWLELRGTLLLGGSCVKATEDGQERVRTDRLDEVMVEPGILGPASVLLQAVARQRDQ